MHAGIAYGQRMLDIEIRDGNLIVGRRAPVAPNLADPAQSLRDALEHPIDYPALRLALTPNDHVAIVVDEQMPHMAMLLVPLLEHIQQAGVQPESVTLICPRASAQQSWLNDLPDAFQDVNVEVHQPKDRKKVAYLATTRKERRIYLNRTAVDADQLVVLTRRRFDPRIGYAGGTLDIYPALSDEETATSVSGGKELQAEAREVSWLLGAPFFVQLIEGEADGFAHITAGPGESGAVGERLLDERWRIEFDRPADVAIATITGDPSRQTIDDLARAFAAAAAVVKPGGSIVLLTEAAPALESEFQVIRKQDDPSLLAPLLSEHSAAALWAAAANQARLYLLSGLAADVAEELFTIPLQHAGQVSKLLTDTATVALIPDAHKVHAVLSSR
jgi:nickel-dependent lactate racemase